MNNHLNKLKHIVLNKGHNIQIAGVPSKEIIPLTSVETVSIIPTEFRGVKPKLLVKEGDKVELGTPLFFDKSKPDIRWASPASGLVSSVQYGARRIVEKIEIKVEGFEAKPFKALTKDQLSSANRKTILGLILEANLFPLIRQRPFNKIADPKIMPRDIFISIILSVCGIIWVTYGWKCGAITTPTPDAGVLSDEQMNLYPSMLYWVDSSSQVSDMKRICMSCSSMYPISCFAFVVSIMFCTFHLAIFISLVL